LNVDQQALFRHHDLGEFVQVHVANFWREPLPNRQAEFHQAQGNVHLHLTLSGLNVRDLDVKPSRIPTIAKFWFDLEDDAINILEGTSLQQLLSLSHSTTQLLRLREGASVLYWQRLLIGESVHDSNAAFISHNTALLALGKWQMSDKHALAR